jgi:hypothetical protein
MAHESHSLAKLTALPKWAITAMPASSATPAMRSQARGSEYSKAVTSMAAPIEPGSEKRE